MTASRIHILLAALMGAAGVALWAYAAHRGGPNVGVAAQLLLIHACAVIALTACRKQGLIGNKTAGLAVAALILGSILFAGDVALRSAMGVGLFPFAAPAGGSLQIVGWLLAAAAALAG
jgi:uncharacterized membrane protein YgdD (TMEM256/DUF423 family)